MLKVAGPIRGKVPLSMRALVQRINRAIQQDCRLKITRGRRAHLDLGDYYVLNIGRNWIVEKDVDPEELGRRLGCIEPYEYVVQDERE